MYDLVKFLLEKGYFLMFSDFSLKALIGSWSEAHLGPKPFKKIGEISTGFNMKFDAKALSECDSA